MTPHLLLFLTAIFSRLPLSLPFSFSPPPLPAPLSPHSLALSDVSDFVVSVLPGDLVEYIADGQPSYARFQSFLPPNKVTLSSPTFMSDTADHLPSPTTTTDITSLTTVYSAEVLPADLLLALASCPSAASLPPPSDSSASLDTLWRAHKQRGGGKGGRANMLSKKEIASLPVLSQDVVRQAQKRGSHVVDALCSVGAIFPIVDLEAEPPSHLLAPAALTTACLLNTDRSRFKRLPCVRLPPSTEDEGAEGKRKKRAKSGEKRAKSGQNAQIVAQNAQKVTRNAL